MAIMPKREIEMPSYFSDVTLRDDVVAPYDFNRVTKFVAQDGNMSNIDNKERIKTLAFIAPNPRFDPKQKYSKRYVCAIDVRLFMGRSANASMVYAQVWASSRDGKTYTRGHGTATGGGYDKQSAAIDSAMGNAGFSFISHFDGCGDESINIAIRAVAKKLGWNTGEIMQF